MPNSNKMLSFITLLAMSASVSSAYAQHDEQNYKIKNNFFYATAKVVNIEPIIKTVQVSIPKKECWEEEITTPVYTQRHNEHGTALFGGIVGGIVGNQFGRGDGKTAATVVGSIIGAAVGNDVAQQKHVVTRSERVDVERHCRVTQTSHSEQQTEGFWVTYRYKGKMFTSRMEQEPGKHLKVRVQVSAVLN